jgi:hypothetical protein
MVIIIFSSTNIIRIIKTKGYERAGHVTRTGEARNPYRVSVEKVERKRPLGKPRRRLEDNINMELIEIGLKYVDWIHRAQDMDQ